MDFLSCLLFNISLSDPANILILVFLIALITTIPIVWIVRRYAGKIGLLDKPSERKIHTRIVARCGGIGIFLGVMVASIIGWFIFAEYLKSSEIPSNFSRELFLILGCGAIVFLTGLIDDRYDLTPWTKIALESLVAVILFYFDIRITFFVPNLIFSFVVTWGWVLFITNSFNLLDNMDGLSAGVAFISGAIFLIVAIQTNQWLIALMMVALLGGLLGFLSFNFPPASIFMGDCGSLFIGYMMSVLTVHATFYQTEFPSFSVALPLLVLAVPIFDTTTVSMLRWRAKTSIFKGDKRHFSHRLVNLGLTSKQAVLVIYLITFTIGISALFLYQINVAGAILVVIQIVSLLTIIHILEQVANQPEQAQQTHQSPQTDQPRQTQ